MRRQVIVYIPEDAIPRLHKLASERGIETTGKPCARVAGELLASLLELPAPMEHGGAMKRGKPKERSARAKRAADKRWQKDKQAY